jgi:hypothetical protein
MSPTAHNRQLEMDVDQQRPIVRIAKYLTPKAAPDTVYHYSSLKGAEGILSTRKIWATDVRYVNDESEYKYALFLAADYLAAIEEQAGNDHERLDFARALNAGAGMHENAAAYVASFSHDSNQLSQWRAYTGGLAGASLGFDSKTLINLTMHQAYFAECVYELSRQREIIDELGREVYEYFKRMIAAGIVLKDALIQASTEFHTVLGIVAPILKHPSFFEEREWRLVIPPASAGTASPQFRVGRSQMIPFIELPLESEEVPMKLNLIVVGPTPNRDTALASFRTFCRVKQVPVDHVAISPIPYRDW